MMIRTGMVNFSKGVLSARVWGRVDVAAYNAGLRQGENIVVLKHGGFTLRPGWRFVSEAEADGERVFSFQFSDQQPYALAFGQAYMQPMTQGGVVLEEELTILGATNTNPMVLRVDYHGYSVGDRWFVQGVAGALGGFLNGRVWRVVAVPDATHIAINLDGTALPFFTSATGGTTRVAPPPPPPPPPPVPPPIEPPVSPPVYSGGDGSGRFFIGHGGFVEP
jgi:hypothetical protein